MTRIAAQKAPISGEQEYTQDATSKTPTSTATTMLDEDSHSQKHHARSLQPGRTYLIQSADNAQQYVTLLEGQVVVTAQSDGHGSSHWKCVKTSGWFSGGILGFQNKASAKYLGHDGQMPDGRMQCMAERHLLWEHMHVNPHPTVPEAFELLSEYWFGWRPVGVSSKDGGNGSSLRRLDNPSDERTAWVFIEVA